MSRLVYLIGLVCLLFSCGLFKTKKSIRLTNVSSNRETDIRNEQRLLVIRDSTLEDLMVEIVPIGNFSYSLNEGFRGSGSSIKMIGRKNGIKEILEETNLGNVHQQLEKKTATKTTTDTVVKRDGLKLGIGFSFLLMCLILLGILWLWWKWR